MIPARCSAESGTQQAHLAGPTPPWTRLPGQPQGSEPGVDLRIDGGPVTSVALRGGVTRSAEREDRVYPRSAVRACAGRPLPGAGAGADCRRLRRGEPRRGRAAGSGASGPVVPGGSVGAGSQVALGRLVVGPRRRWVCARSRVMARVPPVMADDWVPATPRRRTGGNAVVGVGRAAV